MSDSWEAPRTDYTVQDDGTIHTDASIRQRITGTAMGGLLGCSPYETPFSMTTKLMGLWDKDIGNNPAVMTGKLLEPRIIDYVCKTYPQVGMFYKAEDIFAKREGRHEDWESDFEDDVFGGHVDGIVSKDGQDYILEVKTANSVQAMNWREHPPEHYLWQVYLYNAFLTKKDKAYMVLGIVDNQAYSNPNTWIPSTQNTYLFEIDIDQQKVSETIDRIRQMYLDTVEKGISTPATEHPKDVEILNHLKDIKSSSVEIRALADEYLALRKYNEDYINANKSNVDKEEKLKAKLKDIMNCNNLSKVGKIKVRYQDKVSFDMKSAEMDGFDWSKYKRTTKTVVLTVDKD